MIFLWLYHSIYVIQLIRSPAILIAYIPVVSTRFYLTANVFTTKVRFGSILHLVWNCISYFFELSKELCKYSRKEIEIWIRPRAMHMSIEMYAAKDKLTRAENEEWIEIYMRTCKCPLNFFNDIAYVCPYVYVCVCLLNSLNSQSLGPTLWNFERIIYDNYGDSRNNLSSWLSAEKKKRKSRK